jgi:hypothetical protein
MNLVFFSEKNAFLTVPNAMRNFPSQSREDPRFENLGEENMDSRKMANDDSSSRTGRHKSVMIKGIVFDVKSVDTKYKQCILCKKASQLESIKEKDR